MSERKLPYSGPHSPANDLSPDMRARVTGAAALALDEVRAQIRAPRARIDRETLGAAMRMIDLVLLAALALAGAVTMAAGDAALAPAGRMWPVLVFPMVAALLLASFGLYRINPLTPAWDRILRGFLAAALAGIAAMAVTRLAAPAAAADAAWFALVGVAALTLLHIVYAVFIRRWAVAGRLAANIVLVGATANARKLIEANTRRRAVNILGVFDDRMGRSPSRLAGAPYLGAVRDLAAWPLLPEVDRIVVTVTPNAVNRVRDLLARLRILPHPVSLLLDFDDFDPETTTLADIADAPAAQLSGSARGPGWRIVKRLEDLLIGSVMLIVAAPVMAIVALLVRLDSPGPVLFRQQREGFNGRTIEVLKFRSMRHDAASEDGPIRQVERDDPRVTRIGGFLRKTSLDELPQLWNVMRGEMSLVGPRPHAPGMKTGGALTSSLVAEYAHRHRVKPGLTGWAQVNGSRGPLHSPEAARERVRLDVAYIARANLWFDLWIMARTLPALLGDRLNVR